MENTNQEGCVAFLNSRPDPKHNKLSKKTFQSVRVSQTSTGTERLHRKGKKTTGRETAAFPCTGHMWICQSDQHLTPVIRKKLIPVVLRQLNILLQKFNVWCQNSTPGEETTSGETGKAKAEENTPWLQQKTNMLMPLLSTGLWTRRNRGHGLFPGAHLRCSHCN